MDLDDDADSDPDTGGSYISATPPRDPEPPQRPAVLQLPSFTIIPKARVSSNSRPILNPKSIVKRRKPDPKGEICYTSTNDGTKAGSCRVRVSANTRPILKQKGCLRSKKKSGQKVEEDVEKNAVDFDSFSVANLPFHIRECVDVNRVRCGGAESLPAGFFSKNASFSKIRRGSLDLESTDASPCMSSVCARELDSRSLEGWEMKTVKVEEVVARVSGSDVKKNVNLVGGSAVEVAPKKRAKVINEGNFVRLNINGYGHKRKFMNKGSRRSQFSSSGNRYFKRYKKSLSSKDGADGDG